MAASYTYVVAVAASYCSVLGPVALACHLPGAYAGE